MNRLTSLIFTSVFLLSLLFNHSASAQFSPQFGSPSQGSFLADIAIGDSNTILVTGSNVLSTTIDGARNWYTLSYAGMFVEAACYPSIRFGIAVGNQGKYRVNRDCGYYFGWSTTYYVGVNQDLMDVHFTTDRKGYVCGLAGTLVRTVNQGANWTTIPTGTTANLNGLYATSDSTAFVCGDNGTILKVLNNTVISSQSIAAVNLNKIHFTSSTIGYVVGNTGAIYKTTDAGTTWSPLTIATTADLTALDFTSSTHGVISAFGGAVFVTNDAGATWTAAVTNVTGNLVSIAFVNDLEGYSCGTNFVIRTTNGGLTWKPTQSTVRRVQFPEKQTGYALGSGLFYKTTNGGNEWESSRIPTGGYNGMHFQNRDTGYVVGASGVVSRTLNGGSTWSSITVPTTNSLSDVFFTSYQKGVIIGAQRILYTTNAGVSWTNVSPSTTATFNDVTFASPNVGFATTSGGAICKTVNGGANWSFQTSGNSNSLTKIFFTDINNGWAVGTNGTILHTSNGGTNWSAQASGVTVWLTSVHFFNNQVGVITGYGGTCLITENGGLTWQNRSTGSNTIDYSDSYFTDSIHGYVTANSRVYTLGAFSLGAPQSAYCPYDSYGFKTFAPYYANNTPVTAVFEITSVNDDFSNSQIMDTLLVDSVGTVNAYLPQNLNPGLYKLRIRAADNPEHTSFSKVIRILQGPTVNIIYSDSLLIAIASNNTSTFQWQYRPTPQTVYPTNMGSNDSLAVTNPGEYRVIVTSECCSYTSDWFYLTNCNNTLVSSPLHQVSHSICQGDSITVGSHTYYQSGIYSDTLTGTSSCDSIVRTTLTVNPIKHVYPTAYICQGDSLFLQGNYQLTAGTYSDTLTTSSGCDSIVHTTLVLHPVYSTDTTIFRCASDSLFLQGAFRSNPGIYTDTLQSINGCDSIVHTDLQFYPEYEMPLTVSICATDSIFLQGAYQSLAGTYFDTLQTIHGCDSVLITELIVHPVFETTLTAMICPGDSIFLQGNYQINLGIYSDTLQTQHGCDSVLVTALSFYPAYTTNLTANICPDDSLFLQGNYQTNPGIYSDTLQSIHGCDSVLVTALSFYPVYTTNLTANICPDDSLFLQGNYQDAPGVYSDTLQSIHGCDSIVVTTLSYYPVYTSQLSAVICASDSIYLQGAYRNVSGIYTDTLQTIHGCDSILQTNLQVLPEYQSSSSVSICAGDSILVNGHYLSISGTYSDTLSAVNGCDSIVVTILDVLPSLAEPNITQVGITLNCSVTGMVNYEWFFDNNPLNCTTASCSCTENGSYVVIITDANGCSSESQPYISSGCDVGLNSLDLTAIRIFPNPSLGTLSIDLGQEYASGTITITDLQGRVILKKQLLNQQYDTMEIQEASGMYYICISFSENEQYLFKWTLQ